MFSTFSAVQYLYQTNITFTVLSGRFCALHLKDPRHWRSAKYFSCIFYGHKISMRQPEKSLYNLFFKCKSLIEFYLILSSRIITKICQSVFSPVTWQKKLMIYSYRATHIDFCKVIGQ